MMDVVYCVGLASRKKFLFSRASAEKEKRNVSATDLPVIAVFIIFPRGLAAENGAAITAARQGHVRSPRSCSATLLTV